MMAPPKANSINALAADDTQGLIDAEALDQHSGGGNAQDMPWPRVSLPMTMMSAPRRLLSYDLKDAAYATAAIHD